MTDFSDLELLAQQDIDFAAAEALAKEAPHYQNVPLEELADLLEGRVEAYTLLLPTLPARLRQSAKKEIEFFATLFQTRLEDLLQQPHGSSQQRQVQFT